MLKAEQPGTFAAQGEDLGDQRPVVVRARVHAAGNPGAPGDLADVAAGREGEEGLDQGARQGDQVAVLATLGGGLARALNDEPGQADEIGFAEPHRPFALVMQHVLAEIGVQRGQAGVDLGHPHAAGLIQASAGAHEAEMAAFEQAQLVGIQAEACPALMQGGDAGEQGGVERDAALMGGELGRHLALDLLQRRVAMTAHQVEEQGGDAAQGAAAALHRDDGVGEARRCRGGGDGFDLGPVVLHALVEGRGEIRRRNSVEGWRTEWGGPADEERILCHDVEVPGIGGRRQGDGVGVV